HQAAKEGTPRAWRPAGVRAASTRLPTTPKVVAAIRPMPTRWWAALWSQQYRPPRRRSGAAPSTSSAPPASTARRIARSRPLRVLVVSTLVLLRLVAMVAPGRCSPIALRTPSPPPLAGGLARVPGRTPWGDAENDPLDDLPHPPSRPHRAVRTTLPSGWGKPPD